MNTSSLQVPGEEKRFIHKEKVYSIKNSPDIALEENAALPIISIDGIPDEVFFLEKDLETVRRIYGDVPVRDVDSLFFNFVIRPGRIQKGKIMKLTHPAFAGSPAEILHIDVAEQAVWVKTLPKIDYDCLQKRGLCKQSGLNEIMGKHYQAPQAKFDPDRLQPLGADIQTGTIQVGTTEMAVEIWDGKTFANGFQYMKIPYSDLEISPYKLTKSDFEMLDREPDNTVDKVVNSSDCCGFSAGKIAEIKRGKFTGLMVCVDYIENGVAVTHPVNEPMCGRIEHFDCIERKDGTSGKVDRDIQTGAAVPKTLRDYDLVRDYYGNYFMVYQVESGRWQGVRRNDNKEFQLEIGALGYFEIMCDDNSCVDINKRRVCVRDSVIVRPNDARGVVVSTYNGSIAVRLDGMQRPYFYDGSEVRIVADERAPPRAQHRRAEPRWMVPGVVVIFGRRERRGILRRLYDDGELVDIQEYEHGKLGEIERRRHVDDIRRPDHVYKDDDVIVFEGDRIFEGKALDSDKERHMRIRTRDGTTVEKNRGDVYRIADKR